LGHINFFIVAHVTLDTVKHQHSKTMGHSVVHAKYLNLHSTMMMRKATNIDQRMIGGEVI
jgi:hypothetical protein